ncbi:MULTISPECIES: nucleotidyltransferase family protein [unclassified Paenibacillus]|uniref:nucleotidyltransferase family protein n=1 Tax=unclassified Paenibacillus TaxID=185978 RepID=UPI0009552DE5|nr:MULTISPECIES: nucleotidyltransferase family protein [unclassified Paenibacillus]ASS66836.1 nucleotidyltransferase family protein [Paenibacillus sp. RUD330]SIP93843.1 molybdenum cofactor cytidylyltransferase [Paenibacillus sp. RU4X]SIQ12370.1 molybdenum cofactor cytidylyltransferase [Paenibacillus sp. RU4T]
MRTSGEEAEDRGALETNRPLKITGICLAAGFSRRMGFPKLRQPLPDGEPLGASAVRAMAGAGLQRLLVVLREDDDGSWLPGGSGEAAGDAAVEIVACRDASLGMAHSLRCGLAAADDGACGEPPDAVLVALADQPLVDAGLLARLADVLLRNPKLDWAACALQGVPMPPAIMRRSMFPALAALEGDRGARQLFAGAGFRGEMLGDVAESSLYDADTPEDLEMIAGAWLNRKPAAGRGAQVP